MNGLSFKSLIICFQVVLKFVYLALGTGLAALLGKKYFYHLIIWIIHMLLNYLHFVSRAA